MRWQSQLLTVGLLAFLSLKAVERIYFVESWPLTHAPMFSSRIEPESSGFQLTVLGTRDGRRWIRIRPGDVGLNPNRFRGRLVRAVLRGGGRLECVRLATAYNERRPRPRRLGRLVIQVSAADPAARERGGGEQVIECHPLEKGTP